MSIAPYLLPLEERIKPENRKQAQKHFQSLDLNRTSKKINEFLIDIYHATKHLIKILTLQIFLKDQMTQIKRKHYSAAQKYFKLHQFLLKISIYLAIITMLLIYLPNFFNNFDFNSWSSLNACEKEEILMNTNLTEEKAAGCFDKSRQAQVKPVDWYDYVLDVITGSGFLIESKFFIGGFNNIYLLKNSARYAARNSSVGSKGNDLIDCQIRFDTSGENDSFSFLYASFFLLVSLIILINITQVARNKIVKNLSESADNFRLCTQLFTGYDLNQTEKVDIELTSENLKQNFQKFHYQIQEEKLRESQTYLTFFIRGLTWFFCLVILFTGLLTIATATAISQEFISQAQQKFDESGRKNLLDGLILLILEYLPSFSITLVNFLSSLIFVAAFQDNNLVWERHTANSIINVTILRKAGVRFSTLVFYYLTLWGQISCGEVGVKTETPDFILNALYVEKPGYNATCDFCDKTPCWETFIGQNLYRLAITTMLLGIFLNFLFFEVLGSRLNIEFLKPVYTVTYVENSLLDIVYFQLIIWSGYFFCPALLPISFAYLLLTYILLSWSGIHNFKSVDDILSYDDASDLTVDFEEKKHKVQIAKRLQKREIRRKKALLLYDRDYFFYYTLGIGFLVSFICVLFSIVNIKPSYWCSPFSFERQFHSSSSMIKSIEFYSTGFVKYWQGEWNWIFSLVLVYLFWFARNWAENRRDTIDLMKTRFGKKMLKLE